MEVYPAPHPAPGGNSPTSAGRHRAAALLLVFLSLGVSLTGCRKKELTATEIRAITYEMVAAAQKATEPLPQHAEITVRPESRTAVPNPREPAPPSGEVVTYHIYILLPDFGVRGILEEELDQVAQRHGLERDPTAPGPVGTGLVRFGYRFRNLHTHVIHIVAPVARPRALRELAARPRNPRTGPAGSKGGGAGPQLAIILDDLGYDRAAADAALSLGFPLTLSVLPHLPFSAEIAEEAHRRGYEVLLHLPMESANGDAGPEAIELRPGMTPEQVARILSAMLDTVPHAAGVNNHQGSLATADPRLMAAMMPVLLERGLFFVDSRTTPVTVAYEAARRAGLPAAYRNVAFLDDRPTREAVLSQLALDERQARLQGWAIAIGHPHLATLQALQEFLPQLEARGIRLVYASQLVQ